MEFIALILAIAAIILFLIVAFQARPWNLLALGLACLSGALTIWHITGGLRPFIGDGS
jgi:NO-binding membrane sensor protein with MHYT domain